jgi:hemerythrin HHE cation binding domain-containing protein
MMTLKIPEALKVEHDELHAELSKAIRAGGKTGLAAKAVADLLHPHFLSEEEFALPPLGALSELAAGRLARDAGDALAMSERLRRELPRMLGEHEAIVAALRTLTRAAKAEKKPGIARFAEKLTLHAKSEEQVLYPAAILIGLYLKQVLRTHMPE